MKYYNQQELGKRIKHVREVSGLTQLKLAEEMISAVRRAYDERVSK